MVLGPIFSFGARNFVVDQTLSTNKTDDDDNVHAAAIHLMCYVDCVCKYVQYNTTCVCVCL